MTDKLELQAAAAQIAELAASHEEEARRVRELAARRLKVGTEEAIAAAIETDITAEVCAGKARGLREVLKRAGFTDLAGKGV
jgi:hypothetical protein